MPFWSSELLLKHPYIIRIPKYIFFPRKEYFTFSVTTYSLK